MLYNCLSRDPGISQGSRSPSLPEQGFPLLHTSMVVIVCCVNDLFRYSCVSMSNIWPTVLHTPPGRGSHQVASHLAQMFPVIDQA